MQYLHPTYRSDELICKDPPKGQLAKDAPAAIVSDRIIGIDEAGEDCRQKLRAARQKQEIFDDVVDQINKKGGKIK